MVNPGATRVKMSLVPAIVRALGGCEQVSVAMTSRGDFHDRLRASHDLVVAYGGDGTVNRLLTMAQISMAQPLGVIPGGYANVLARQVGPLDNPISIAQSIGRNFIKGNVEPVQLGRVNGRTFCSSVGVGIAADIMHRASARRSGGTVPSAGTYLRSGVAAYRASRSHPNQLSATIDGDPAEPVLALVAQVRWPLTYLGPVPISLASRRTNTNSALSVWSIHNLSTVATIREAAHLFTGSRFRSAGSKALGGARRITVEAERPVRVQVDGEYVGNTTTVDIDESPDQLLLIRNDSAESGG